MRITIQVIDSVETADFMILLAENRLLHLVTKIEREMPTSEQPKSTYAEKLAYRVTGAFGIHEEKTTPFVADLSDPKAVALQAGTEPPQRRKSIGRRRYYGKASGLNRAATIIKTFTEQTSFYGEEAKAVLKKEGFKPNIEGVSRMVRDGLLKARKDSVGVTVYEITVGGAKALAEAEVNKLEREREGVNG